MQELLDKKVTVTLKDGEKINGILYDYNDNHIQIEEEDDIRSYKLANITKIEEIQEEAEEEDNRNELEKMLDAEGYDWWCCDVSYGIEGFTYCVTVDLNEDGTYTCETLHKERLNQLKRKRIHDPYVDEYAGASANERTYKTLKGVRNYLEKFLNA